uniref:Uncharacterized protein n=1 Tax=viral metagenome TaxID=1070528 RepID=A0A6M3LH39_9ZZZZ
MTGPQLEASDKDKEYFRKHTFPGTIIEENKNLRREADTLRQQLADCRKNALLEAADFIASRDEPMGSIADKLRRMAEEQST